MSCTAIHDAIVNVLRVMHALTCTQHGGEFDVQEAIEHVRRFHASFIKRRGRPGEIDAHVHMRYCFDCSSSVKNHRSYDFDNAMWKHLRRNHDTIVDCVVHS